MSNKELIASIVRCLTQLLDEDQTKLDADSRESVEVAVQCLESAYHVQARDASPKFDIMKLYKELCSKKSAADIDPASRVEADRLKNDGNELLKNGKFQEAIDSYSKAIQLDNTNAVFYCNRAAAYSKVGNHPMAIKDCHAALEIDPNYSKAYGRLGLAYSSLEQYKEAKESYQKALELEPDNESIRNNLQIAEEKLAQQGVGNIELGNGGTGFPNMDLTSLLSNPALMNMARHMLSDPSMQSMMSNLMSGEVEQGGRMNAFIQAGQQLAQQMQSANPELIESLRRQMGGNPNDLDPSQDQQ